MLYEKYERLKETYNINEDNHADNLSDAIKSGLREFISTHRRVAIYCYGIHTKMLMSDFMYELKDIRYIIENYNSVSESGFEIITDEQIEDSEIDGVIISSFKFKDRIKDDIHNKHEKVDAFDIYDYLMKKIGSSPVNEVTNSKNNNKKKYKLKN